MSNIYFVMVVSYFFMTFWHFLVHFSLFFCFSSFIEIIQWLGGVRVFFFGVETWQGLGSYNGAGGVEILKIRHLGSK